MIAVISDIHGNYPALLAVLADADAMGCRQIYSLGDVGGYYCMVNECIRELWDRSIINLMGNHDYYLVANEPCPRSRSANDCLNYQRQVITRPNLAWLGDSPSEFRSGAISMVHGGWHDPRDEYLYEISSAYFSQRPGSFFFSGHTHVQIFAALDVKTFCNPGSVGQPRDGDPRAAYAILNENDIILRRVEYDIDAICFEMDRADFDRRVYENLYKGTRIGGEVSHVIVV